MKLDCYFLFLFLLYEPPKVTWCDEDSRFPQTGIALYPQNFYGDSPSGSLGYNYSSIYIHKPRNVLLGCGNARLFRVGQAGPVNQQHVHLRTFLKFQWRFHVSNVPGNMILTWSLPQSTADIRALSDHAKVPVELQLRSFCCLVQISLVPAEWAQVPNWDIRHRPHATFQKSHHFGAQTLEYLRFISPLFDCWTHGKYNDPAISNLVMGDDRLVKNNTIYFHRLDIRHSTSSMRNNSKRLAMSLARARRKLNINTIKEWTEIRWEKLRDSGRVGSYDPTTYSPETGLTG